MRKELVVIEIVELVDKYFLAIIVEVIVWYSYMKVWL